MTCISCGAAVAARRKYCDDCRDTSAPWRPDADAVDRAREHLGITVPVQIRRSATRKLLGRYHGIRLHADAPRDPAVIAVTSDEELNRLMHHHITVSARLTPEAASRVIWHEMTHAAQYERDPDYYVNQYTDELRNAKRLAALTRQPFDKFYRMISFEVEAKANEDNHYTLFSLAKSNTRANMPALRRPHSRIDRVVDGQIVSGAHADVFERQALKNISTAKTMLRV